MIKYGYEHSFQSPIVKNKIRNSLFKKYGVYHSSNIPGILKKKMETSIHKYGVKFPMQSSLVKSKQYNTNLSRYGVKYPNQSSIVQQKSQKNGLRFKEYITPNGEIRKVQGYEPRALDTLFKTYNLPESDVITDRSKVPRINYTSNNLSRYYFPDIYIPSQNKIIEVKSTWTYKLHADQNKLKWDATRAAGFICEVWVYDKNTLQTIHT